VLGGVLNTEVQKYTFSWLAIGNDRIVFRPLDGGHVALLQFEALLLHPAVVPVGHLELVNIAELGCALVEEL